MQNNLTWIILVLSCISLLIVQKILRAKNIFRNTIFNILLGLSLLFLISITSNLSGVILPISLVSLVIVATLGVPGITLMLLLNMFI